MKYSINIKTNYSLLSSIIKTKDLILFAKENNIKYLGITNEYMFNFIEFYDECISNNIKPILGVNFIINSISFYLYPRNYEGYEIICKNVTNQNKKILTFENIVINNNLIIVCNINDYEFFHDNKYVFLKYEDDEEKKKCLKISNNIVKFDKVLCLNKEDTLYLKYLYMIKDETYKNSDFSNYYFKDINEDDKMHLDEFASLVDIKMSKFEVIMPVYCENSYETLVHLCDKGINKRLLNNVSDEYKNRLNTELKTIRELGYVDYILIVYDYVLHSKKNNIYVGPGRGSAVGSLVCYALGITEIDPLKFDLMFERFLNKERSSMPDIDIDFEDKRRNEVIDYVKKRYKSSFNASVIAFDTLSFKQALRDIGRVLNTPSFKINKLISLLKNDLTYKEALKNSSFIGYIKYDEESAKIVNIASHLEGAKRHTSVHAAGLILSSIPIENRVPLYISNDNVLTSYSKEYIENMGLLKMDFLGIKNLTIINNVLSDIEKTYRKKLNLNKISLDDEKTYKIFKNASTLGIFQFESSGMRSFIKQFVINNFNDLVNALSLYRPGPRDMINEAINRKNNNKIYDIYSSCLKDTYGIIIYQEQIMKILNEIGAYSLNQSDIIRRKMSKNNVSFIEKERNNFINNACVKGFTEEKANKIFNDLVAFSGFSFNKSHAVAYSLISYQMAYLKVNFKEIFIMNLLKEYILSPSKTKEYIEEAKTLEIVFEKPNINFSENKYVIKDNKVILPLSIVKNIGVTSCNMILEERKKGVFKDIYDLFERLCSININKGIFVSLIQSGAFDIFGYNRKTLIKNLSVLLDYALLCCDIDSSLVSKPNIEKYEEYDNVELFVMEENLFGFFITNHPVTYYNRSNCVKLKDISSHFNKFINSVVYTDKIKVINTKNGEKMAFLTVSDDTSSSECIMFSKEYEKYNDINVNSVLRIVGKVEKRFDSYQIIISKVEILK